MASSESSPALVGGVLYHDVHVALLQGAADVGPEQVDLLDEVEGPGVLLQSVEHLVHHSSRPFPFHTHCPRSHGPGTVPEVEPPNFRAIASSIMRGRPAAGAP